MDETSLHTTLDISTRKTTDVRVKYEKDLAADEHQRAEQHAVFLPPHLLELMHSTESWWDNVCLRGKLATNKELNKLCRSQNLLNPAEIKNENCLRKEIITQHKSNTFKHLFFFPFSTIFKWTLLMTAGSQRREYLVLIQYVSVFGGMVVNSSGSYSIHYPQCTVARMFFVSAWWTFGFMCVICLTFARSSCRRSKKTHSSPDHAGAARGE